MTAKRFLDGVTDDLRTPESGTEYFCDELAKHHADGFGVLVVYGGAKVPAKVPQPLRETLKLRLKLCKERDSRWQGKKSVNRVDDVGLERFLELTELRNSVPGKLRNLWNRIVNERLDSRCLLPQPKVELAQRTGQRLTNSQRNVRELRPSQRNLVRERLKLLVGNLLRHIPHQLHVRFILTDRVRQSEKLRNVVRDRTCKAKLAKNRRLLSRTQATKSLLKILHNVGHRTERAVRFLNTNTKIAERLRVLVGRTRKVTQDNAKGFAALSALDPLTSKSAQHRSRFFNWNANQTDTSASPHKRLTKLLHACVRQGCNTNNDVRNLRHVCKVFGGIR